MRVELPEWLALVRQLPCLHCASGAGSQPHHVSNRGLSQKDHDTAVIPLCVECHTRHHAGGAPSPGECRDYLAVLMEAVIGYGLLYVPKAVLRPHLAASLEDFCRAHIETYHRERRGE